MQVMCTKSEIQFGTDTDTGFPVLVDTVCDKYL